MPRALYVCAKEHTYVQFIFRFEQMPVLMLKFPLFTEHSNGSFTG